MSSQQDPNVGSATESDGQQPSGTDWNNNKTASTTQTWSSLSQASQEESPRKRRLEKEPVNDEETAQSPSKRSRVSVAPDYKGNAKKRKNNSDNNETGVKACVTSFTDSNKRSVDLNGEGPREGADETERVTVEEDDVEDKVMEDQDLDEDVLKKNDVMEEMPDKETSLKNECQTENEAQMISKESSDSTKVVGGAATANSGMAAARERPRPQTPGGRAKLRQQTLEEVDRLSLASQRSPETVFPRKANMLPAQSEQTVGLPHRKTPQTLEKNNRSQVKRVVIQQNIPSVSTMRNGEQTLRYLRDANSEQQENFEPDPLGTHSQHAPNRSAYPSIPANVEQVAGDNRNNVPAQLVQTKPNALSRLIRSVLFWFIFIFVLQWSYIEFWINPVLHTVVEGSKILTKFYADKFRPQGHFCTAEEGDEINFCTVEEGEEPNLSQNDTVDDTDIPSSFNTWLIEEKLRLREANELWAKRNRETAKENARRAKINNERLQKINELYLEQTYQLQQMNEQTKKNNDRVRSETDRLLTVLESARVAQNELEETKTIEVSAIEKLLVEWEAMKDDLSALLEKESEMRDEASNKIKEFDESLLLKVGNMEEIVTLFSNIANPSKSFAQSKEDLARARELLGETEEDKLIDVFAVELWEPTGIAVCDEATVDSVTSQNSISTNRSNSKNNLILPKPLSEEDGMVLLDKFKNKIAENFDIISEDGIFRDAIETLFYERAEDYPFADLIDVVADNITKPNISSEISTPLAHNSPMKIPKKKKRKKKKGLSTEEIKMLVWDRLQVEWMDQTGLIDYASIMNGARVLRSTPSLVDNLPIGNRLSAMLSLQFYGYGPEAALTPTWPPNSLGQCWAFEWDRRSVLSSKGAENQYHMRVGAMADLTVRLAKPIYVKNITIEHPPSEVTDKPNTALKRFKVIGFESPDGLGYSWPLGTFTYEMVIDGSEPSRQVFEIPRTIQGKDLVKLAAITLAIDSNWGAQVTCLYRFRVHGVEDEEDE